MNNNDDIEILDDFEFESVGQDTLQKIPENDIEKQENESILDDNAWFQQSNNDEMTPNVSNAIGADTENNVIDDNIQANEVIKEDDKEIIENVSNEANNNKETEKIENPIVEIVNNKTTMKLIIVMLVVLFAAVMLMPIIIDFIKNLID